MRVSKNTLDTRKRVRKCRMRKKVHKERQNLIRDRIQNVSLDQIDHLNDESVSNCASEGDRNKSFQHELKEWSKKHNISAGAITQLLKILICYGFTWLPSDYRSFMQTPRNLEISALANGKIWYNGIRKVLEQVFSTLTRDITISLTFNVDGLPLFKSSKLQFWPILASIYGKSYK